MKMWEMKGTYQLYAYVKSYLESLRTHLSRSDDRDIIVNKVCVVKLAGAVNELIAIALLDDIE